MRMDIFARGLRLMFATASVVFVYECAVQFRCIEIDVFLVSILRSLIDQFYSVFLRFRFASKFNLNVANRSNSLDLKMLNEYFHSKRRSNPLTLFNQLPVSIDFALENKAERKMLNLNFNWNLIYKKKSIILWFMSTFFSNEFCKCSILKFELRERKWVEMKFWRKWKTRAKTPTEKRNTKTNGIWKTIDKIRSEREHLAHTRRKRIESTFFPQSVEMMRAKKKTVTKSEAKMNRI